MNATKKALAAAKKKIIQRLYRQHHGLIPAEKLVEEAVSPNHPFHNDFDWNNGAAGHKWRVHQARNILRIFLTVIGNNKDAKECRMFVSLSSDRKNGGGYRATIDVLHDDELRSTMLADAKTEMLLFRTKYVVLSELSGVISAIDKVLEFRS